MKQDFNLKVFSLERPNLQFMVCLHSKVMHGVSKKPMNSMQVGKLGHKLVER